MRGTMPEVETVMREAGMPTSLTRRAHGLHEVVVVEEGLALSHENEVDAVAVDLDLLVVEDGEDLADDFAGGEVAVQAEKGGHAEGAFDGAADLAGDADGGAGRRAASGQWLVAAKAGPSTA